MNNNGFDETTNYVQNNQFEQQIYNQNNYNNNSSNNKKVVIIIVIILLIAIGVLVFFLTKKNNNSNSNEPGTKMEEKSQLNSYDLKWGSMQPYYLMDSQEMTFKVVYRGDCTVKTDAKIDGDFQQSVNGQIDSLVLIALMDLNKNGIIKNKEDINNNYAEIVDYIEKELTNNSFEILEHNYVITRLKVNTIKVVED